MARSVPKCKRAAYVYDRDFIVVDDISGVLKMRSECAIDGYGFLSSQGDIRNPQEIPPIINEQMAAWPDPRPIGQPVFTPEPDYQYFLFNYSVLSVQYGSTTFDATATVGLNAPIASMAWSVDGVYAVSGLVPTVPMTNGLHDISVLITDLFGNEQTFTFEYDQTSISANTVLYMAFNGTNGQTTFTDSTGLNNPTRYNTNSYISTAQSVSGGSSLYQPAIYGYVRARNSGDLSNNLIWTGDFSVMLYVRPANIGNYMLFVMCTFDGGGTTNGLQATLTPTGIKIGKTNLTTGLILDLTMAYSVNVWMKIQITRVSGVIYILKDDVVVGSTSTNFGTLGNGNIYIGGVNHMGNTMVGYIDDFIVTKGTA